MSYLKASNPSKNINGIELHLNEDSDTNQYRFNSLFKEVLEKRSSKLLRNFGANFC